MLKDKKVLILGLASNRSIAWGIAQSMFQHGAQLGFACQNERMVDRTERLTKQCNAHFSLPCDLSSDEQIDDLVQKVGEIWDEIDCIVHAIAFAPKESLSGDYLSGLSREAFRVAHDISSYSFAAAAKAFRSMMSAQSSLITLSYLGGQRVVPGYNVMGLAKASLEMNVKYLAHCLGANGIRVNAISAGAIRTLASSGIEKFGPLIKASEVLSPLRRNITIEEVGNVATFLASPMSSAVNAEVIYVDTGLHALAGDLVQIK